MFDPLTGFDPKQAMTCKYLTGFWPLETELTMMHLVYSLPDGRCFTFSNVEEDKARYIGTVEEIEKDFKENEGRFFALTSADALGEHSPADKKFCMILGSEILKDLETLEKEFPEPPGIFRDFHRILPLEKKWGRALIAPKEQVLAEQRSMVDQLITLACTLIRDEALERGFRAAELAFTIDVDDRRAWALQFASSDDKECKILLDNLALIAGTQADDPNLISELDQLALHLLHA